MVQCGIFRAVSDVKIRILDWVLGPVSCIGKGSKSGRGFKAFRMEKDHKAVIFQGVTQSGILGRKFAEGPRPGFVPLGNKKGPAETCRAP